MADYKTHRKGSFKTQWGNIETFEKHSTKTFKDECSVCGYQGGGFIDIKGFNGWDSYDYSRCPVCGSNRAEAEELKRTGQLKKWQDKMQKKFKNDKEYGEN